MRKVPVPDPSPLPTNRHGIRDILLAGVFWRILIIEAILLIGSVAYRMIAEAGTGMALLWYALRIVALVGVILLFMMVTLGHFLERKIIRPLEAVAEANRRLDVTRPEVDRIDLEPDAALEIQEIVATRAKTLEAILQVSHQRLQLVNLIRETFGRYLSRQIVDEILESPEGRRIGGRRQTVTVVMSDLRGFSDISDSRDPEEMVRILNRYLETMTQVIQRYDGVIDEFMGDAILTVFGIPEERADDPMRAVACALEMQRTLAHLNRDLVIEGLPALEMGIGINTGAVVVGNLGSEARTKYGIVGAAVNIASRIESNTIGGQVLVGEATYERIRQTVTAQPPVTVMMKGLKRPLVCYPVTAIGPPYDVSFSVARQERMVEIRLPFSLWRLEGKKVIDGAVTGETRSIGESTWLVDVPLQLAKRCDVKLLITFCPQAHCFSDIYAKVLAVRHEENRWLHHLGITYMDQADKRLLNQWAAATGAWSDGTPP